MPEINAIIIYFLQYSQHFALPQWDKFALKMTQVRWPQTLLGPESNAMKSSSPHSRRCLNRAPLSRTQSMSAVNSISISTKESKKKQTKLQWKWRTNGALPTQTGPTQANGRTSVSTTAPRKSLSSKCAVLSRTQTSPQSSMCVHQ